MQQGGLSETVNCFDLRAASEQYPSDLHATVGSREHERCPPIDRPRGRISACRQQGLDRSYSALCRSKHQGSNSPDLEFNLPRPDGGSLCTAGINVGPGLNQEFDDGAVTPEGRRHQGRLARVIRSIRISASVQQEPRDRDVSAGSGNEQRGLACIVLEV